MNDTLKEIPQVGDTVLIQNLNGGLELVRYPMPHRRPYMMNDFQNWWRNFNEQDFFSTWIKVDHASVF